MYVNIYKRMRGSFMYGGRPSRDAPHCDALQPLRSRKKKKWAGGRVRRAGGRAVTPAARRDPPPRDHPSSEPSELSEAMREPVRFSNKS